MKMAQALASLGHSIRLAVPGKSPPGSQKMIWQNLAHHYGLQLSFPIEWLPSGASLRRHDYALRALGWARTQGADLLYTRLPQAAAIASIIGFPTVYEIHDFPRGVLGPLMFQRFLRGGGARRLVVITHVLSADLSERFGAPASPFTLTAPDGVDLSQYDGLPDPEDARRALCAQGTLVGLSPKAFTAGYTGHLYPGRGAELLLALAERLPQIVFLLVGGETQDVARQQAEVDAKGLKNLFLTGFIPNAELPLYQAACDVLLMPYQKRVAASSGGDISRYLSPMKLFEYLACGRAILSSDLPVFREVLSTENAILLPPEDIEAWTASMLSLQADPQRRSNLAAAARHTARHYTWEARARRIFDGIT
jgi:glycosyltransferase involved in cell wall biosynthesis